MKQTRTWQGLATLPLLNTGHTFAAPIEGEAASNAAAILVLRESHELRGSAPC